MGWSGLGLLIPLWGAAGSASVWVCLGAPQLGQFCSVCTLFSSWTSTLTRNILSKKQVNRNTVSRGLELTRHLFFLALVAKASQMAKLQCWEGPAQVRG